MPIILSSRYSRQRQRKWKKQLKITGVHIQKEDEDLRIISTEEKKDLFASVEDEDMYAAIDKLIDKLDRQVIKYKEKHQAK